MAAGILADYAAEQPEVLARLVSSADPKQFATLLPKLQAHGPRAITLLEAEVAEQAPPDAPDQDKEKLAKRQANAAAALLRLDRPEKAWPLLKHSPDPRARSYLIHCLAPLGVDPKSSSDVWTRKRKFRSGGPCCWPWANSRQDVACCGAAGVSSKLLTIPRGPRRGHSRGGRVAVTAVGSAG